MRTVAVVVLVLLAVKTPSFLLLILAGVAAYGGYRAWRRRRPVAKSPITKTGASPLVVKPDSVLFKYADARARRNGWAPPARPRMVTISVSAECADDACIACPGGGCACPCGHDSRVIVAMNTARRDDGGPVPF